MLIPTDWDSYRNHYVCQNNHIIAALMTMYPIVLWIAVNSNSSWAVSFFKLANNRLSFASYGHLFLCQSFGFTSSRLIQFI